MKPRMLLAPADNAPPERDDILRLLAELRIAVGNDDTLERRFLQMLASYVFHVVGGHKDKVDKSDREIADKIDALEVTIRSIYNEMRTRQKNLEESVNLCLKMANHFFPVKECKKCADVGSAGAKEC